MPLGEGDADRLAHPDVHRPLKPICDVFGHDDMATWVHLDRLIEGIGRWEGLPIDQ